MSTTKLTESLRGAMRAAVLATLALSFGSEAQIGKPPSKPEEPQPPFQVAAANAFTWVGRFNNTNCSWIDMGDGVLVIDTGESVVDGANLAAQVKETTKGKPIKWFVMTHLHSDSNGGFAAFLPNDATVFMNARAIPLYSKGLALRQGKTPTLIGVTDRATVSTKQRRVDLIAPAGPTHTEFDLVAFSPDSQIAFVGDLLIPGHCPQLSDASGDPKNWHDFLDKVGDLHPSAVVTTRLNPSNAVEQELKATKAYLKGVIAMLTDLKARKVPEAGVASAAKLSPVGPYCPDSAQNINLLALYRRINADGSFRHAVAPESPVPPGKAAPKK